MVVMWITGGLGDVFFSWQSAYDFSTQNNIPIALVWERGDHLGSYEQKRFSNFFRVFPKVVDIPFWKPEYGQMFKGIGIDRIITSYDSKGLWNWNQSERCMNELKNMSLSDYKQNNILIRAAFRGIPFPNTVDTERMFKMISPAPKIENRIRSTIGRTGFRAPIGVHIRRTDNSWCISGSPDYLFIDKMKEILSKNPKQKFFLCTDDVDLKSRLREMFKGSVISLDVRERYAEGGLDDSVVEMFLLSKCRKIYGCDSGFSILASKIGRIPHTTLKLEV